MIGRPKLSDGATRAIQLKVGEGEFADLEEWRFANRVDSRSEAVRRLIQIGLRADARALGVAEASRQALELGQKLRLDILDEMEAGRVNDHGGVSVAVEDFEKLMLRVFETNDACTGLLADVLAFHQTIGSIDELEKAMAVRSDYKQLVYDRGDRDYEE